MPEKIIQQNFTLSEGSNVVTFLKPPKHLTDVDHVRLVTDGIMTAILDKGVTGQDLRVLMLCISEMEFENFLNKSQAELAAKLGVKQPDIAKSIKKLIGKNLLRVIGQIGRQNVYRVSPYLAFKSRSRNYKNMLADWDEHED